VLAFFGLTPEYRLIVFTQIHEIVYYGQGGYDWNTVYNMPLWLRKFTYSNILEDLQKKAKANSTDQAIQEGIRSAHSKNIQIPSQNSTYMTKASKK
jgi:hypothetical protein